MQKELIIVAGANGSGKTTLSKQVMLMRDYDFLNADEIAKDIDSQVDAKIQLQAGRIFFATMSQWFLEGKSFILESTLSGKYLTKVIENAKKEGYMITIVYAFLESPQECIERITIRVRNGGHHVPDEDVIRRFYRSKENFWNKYRFLVDSWVLYFNAIQNTQEVSFGVKNDFIIQDKNLFHLFLKDIENGS
jgi:predicted ABC-type ATPase